jgi:hypothetical protein
MVSHALFNVQLFETPVTAAARNELCFLSSFLYQGKDQNNGIAINDA